MLVVRGGKVVGYVGIVNMLVGFDVLIFKMKLFEIGYVFVVSVKGVFIASLDKKNNGKLSFVKLVDEKVNLELEYVVDEIVVGCDG